MTKSRKLIIPEAPLDRDADPCGHSIATEQITADRGSPVFPLTQESAGSINKQETAQSKTLEHAICPLSLSFSTLSPASDPRSIHP